MSSKRYIALSLLVLISFKSLVVPFIYLDFELHKEYIIQSLCENRFNPQLHCDGKCYLAKQLKKVAQEHARRLEQHLAVLAELDIDIDIGLADRVGEDLAVRLRRDVDRCL
ncbi:MAG: hypothetical protein ACK41O_00640, partial [Runella zeae]